MAPPPRWPKEAIDALSQVRPYDKAGLAAFRQRFPDFKQTAINSKLSRLRIRGQAADVDHRRRGNPFPLYRFD